MTIFYLEKSVLIETGQKDEWNIAIRLCPNDKTRVIMLSGWTYFCPTCKELCDLREPQCHVGYEQNVHCKTTSPGDSDHLFYCETHRVNFGYPGEPMTPSNTTH